MTNILHLSIAVLETSVVSIMNMAAVEYSASLRCKTSTSLTRTACRTQGIKSCVMPIKGEIRYEYCAHIYNRIVACETIYFARRKQENRRNVGVRIKLGQKIDPGAYVAI